MHFRTLVLLLPLLATTGCSLGLDALKVELDGTIHEDELGPLTFTEAGYPMIYGRPMNLPRAQEDVHYGLVVVDSTPLPPGWRPESASEGGVVVAAVNRASPLAIAGLRSKDLIVSINGQPAQDPDWVVKKLERAETVEVEIVQQSTGKTRTIKAEAEDDVRAVGTFSIPAVFSVASSTTGTGFTIGPIGTVFDMRSALVTDDKRYVQSTSWGFLFDLIAYNKETDLVTGQTRSRWRLLWFLSFGDDNRGL